ncbi:MAG: nucleoside 2-deoxyribosyltransferase [Prevotellaceae bacterium]|jgi:hypothetical protein|nr:nucleoside 2-deoxyribosyltransferase [Prevotellaceae bacterium]
MENRLEIKTNQNIRDIKDSQMTNVKINETKVAINNPANANSHNRQRVCFLVTPVGDKNTTERRNADGLFKVLQLLLKDFNIDVQCYHRSNYNTAFMTNEIINFLKTSDLVIIDLTGLNPNVMFEYGYRYAIEKPFICIAKEGTILPFDINTIRTIFYEDVGGLLSDEELLRAVKSVLPQDPPTTKDKLGGDEKKISLFKLKNKPDDTRKSINQLFKKHIEN